MKKDKKTGWRRIIDNNLFSMKFMWENDRVYLFLQLFNAVLSGLVGPAYIILTSSLFNMLDGGGSFRDAILILGMMAGVKLFTAVWSQIYGGCIIVKHQQELHYRVQKQIFEKVRSLELACYDDPDFYNEFLLSMQYADSFAATALGNLTSLLNFSFTIVAVTSVLVHVDLIAALIILVSSVLSVIIKTKRNKIAFNQQQDFAPIVRKGHYVDRIFKQADYSKELRLTDLAENLNQLYDENTKEYNSLAMKYGFKKIFMDIVEGLNGNCVYIAVLGVVLYKLMVVGSIMLGGFTVVVNANWQFRNTIVQFAEHIASLPQQSMYMDKVRTFLDYVPVTGGGDLPADEFESLEFKNVYFGYTPDTLVLKDVSIKINRGDKIAIVGYNGAGKTTFIKLLMHLYESNSGEIIYNGISIKNIDTKSYQSRIGAVFQDFRIFAATIAENVLGDEYCHCPEDEKTVLDALRMSTFDTKLSELPNGIHTMLTREFDDEGTNLSGGETQKIAIARVFAKPYDLIIMDEPSSALDPMAEYELNRHIKEFAADKTTIFISHRLSTTHHVDRIYMFEDGRIIESGSHDELMALDGKYAEMFNVQAEKYKL